MGFLSINVEKLGIFHWNADGGESDLVGITFDCIALLVIVHVVWIIGGRWIGRRRSAVVCAFQFAFVFKPG